jgi:hypothetical protein
MYALVAIDAGTKLIHLQLLPSKVLFTFDMWTSGPGDPYLSVTAHYIDTPADKPREWELRVVQLAFKHVEGRHTGKNIADILIEVVDHYGLRGKVSHFTIMMFEVQILLIVTLGWLVYMRWRCREW